MMIFRPMEENRKLVNQLINIEFRFSPNDSSGSFVFRFFT